MWTLLLQLWALVALGGGASFAPHKELLECASQILYMDQHLYQIPTNYNRNIPPVGRECIHPLKGGCYSAEKPHSLQTIISQTIISQPTTLTWPHSSAQNRTLPVEIPGLPQGSQPMSSSGRPLADIMNKCWYETLCPFYLSKNTTVYVGVIVNRVSGVDENKEEITLDVFLQVSWEDQRLHVPVGAENVDLPWAYRQLIWTPDLYIWQLQNMRLMSVLQEMASLRLYNNGTVSVNIGAQITINCAMNFVLYPLDVQNCAIDFSSYKYTSQDLRFEWRDVDPSSGRREQQRGEFRLPKYVVSFVTDKSNHIRNFGEGDHSAARLQIKLERELRSYLLESYLPSTLFVMMSWGSFCVIPEIVPGRMVLLVTTLLSLVTMFDTVSTNSPDALELKCIEVWLIWCTIFVFLALLEYFIVLFGIRYDKSWSRRRVELRRAASAVQLAAPFHINHAQRLSTPAPGSPQGGVFTPQITAEEDSFKQQFSHQTIQRDSPILEPPRTDDGSSSLWQRFGSKLDRGIMFCGAQHGAADKYAIMVFPIFFILFNVVYWSFYVSERNKVK